MLTDILRDRSRSRGRSRTHSRASYLPRYEDEENDREARATNARVWGHQVFPPEQNTRLPEAPPQILQDVVERQQRLEEDHCLEAACRQIEHERFLRALDRHSPTTLPERVAFSKYDGKLDPVALNSWIHQFTAYFAAVPRTDLQKVQLAVCHL